MKHHVWCTDFAAAAEGCRCQGLFDRHPCEGVETSVFPTEPHRAAAVILALVETVRRLVPCVTAVEGLQEREAARNKSAIERSATE